MIGEGYHIMSFPTTTYGIDAHVQATNCLCLSVVRFKGIIPGEDFVKIDVSVKEDIVPLRVGKEQASWESEYCTFGSFEIDGIIVFEFEHEFEFGIDGGTYDRRMIECVEGLIWSSFSGVEVSSELFPISVLIDTGFVCFIINLSWFSAIATFVGCVSALPTYGI